MMAQGSDDDDDFAPVSVSEDKRPGSDDWLHQTQIITWIIIIAAAAGLIYITKLIAAASSSAAG